MNRALVALPRILVTLLLLCSLASNLHAQGRPTSAPPGPADSLSLILGRPTDRAITLSVLSASNLEAGIEYGTKSGMCPEKVNARTLKAGVPCEFEIAGLMPNTRYYYRLLTRTPGKTEFTPEPEATFQTQRAPGSTFTFELQGDSHPERARQMFDATLYSQTLRDAAKDAPDFYLTLGDDFSIDPLIERNTLSASAVDQVYARQRGYLGLVGRSAALFLVNGNHEQAALCNLDGTEANAAVLAGRARTRFYPLPAPGAFYSGDAEEVPFVGLARDYYAWTWGDALFVVIDPYWHSTVPAANTAGERPGNAKGDKGGRNRDLWKVTLGDAQYQWLTRTLTESRAKWKFVFCHHVLGTGRGGVERAGFYEWGGKDERGQSLFAEKRPGWALPIHSLMVKTGVNQALTLPNTDHFFFPPQSAQRAR